MARTDNFANFATDIADSIREKTGETGLIPASEFDTKIKSIETEPNLQDKSITLTENGTTNIVADEGYDGLNSVEVITNIENGSSKEHKKLQYIICNGTCYFEVPTKFNQNTGLEIKFSRLDKWEYIAGVWSTATHNVYNLSAMPTNVQGGRFEGYYGRNGSAASSYIWLLNKTNQDAIWITKGREWYLYDHNMNLIGSHTFANLTFETQIKPYICGVNVYESNESTRDVGFNGSFYYAKIYDGETLLYDLIPVLKKDGSVALYDQVNKTYWENKGTAEPTKGPFEETVEDLTEELTTYDSKLTEQELSINNIIEVLEGKVASTLTTEIYSTEEVKTNKVWIDGKPIYRKVFTGTMPTITNGTFNTLSFDISNLNLASGTDWYGVVVQNNTEKTKWALDWCNYQSKYSSITSISGGAFRVQSNTSTLSNATVYAILEYTKTTDTATTTVEEG